MKKSFYSWLQQFKSDETPLGDFARDAKADKDFPHQASSYKHIHDYLESKRACAEILDIFNESYEQYKKTNETKATELTPTLEYKSWISELKTRYKQAQIKASVAVNGELLKFYFELGKDISEKQFANTYGSAFYKSLSTDLIAEFPDAKGFSPTNLKYAFYFYELYKGEVQNRPQLVDDLYRIPWGHHVQIIGKCKNDSKKALFYIDQIIQNNWSRNVLAKYSLESSAEPLAVSEYELSKFYPLDFKSSLPTIKEIENKLGDIEIQ